MEEDSEAVVSVGLPSEEAAFTVEGSVVVTAISIQCEADNFFTGELLNGGEETGKGGGGDGAGVRTVQGYLTGSIRCCAVDLRAGGDQRYATEIADHLS